MHGSLLSTDLCTPELVAPPLDSLDPFFMGHLCPERPGKDMVLLSGRDFGQPSFVVLDC